MRPCAAVALTILVSALTLLPAHAVLATPPEQHYIDAPFKIRMTVTTSPTPSRVGEAVDFVFTATCDRPIPSAWVQVTLEEGRGVFDHVSLDSARKLKEMLPEEPVVMRKRVVATDCGPFSLRLFYYYPTGRPGEIAHGAEIVFSGCVLPSRESAAASPDSCECSVPNSVLQPSAPREGQR
jgi:hypothetical protein